MYKVTDGDTFQCRLNNGVSLSKVRMANIDAPEIKQAYGLFAKNALSQMIQWQMVELVDIKQDKYKRIVATVIYNGENINLKMVENGHAWAYGKKKIYKLAENKARERRIGLFSSGYAERPSEYRKRSKVKRYTPRRKYTKRYKKYKY